MNSRIYKGHFARKRFGQNFLKDQFVIKSIIAAINPKKGQEIVEIGAGLGALTELVVEHLDHLTVIELDRNLSIRLKNNPSLRSKIKIYQNAMNINFGKFSKKIGRPIRIFGNLPYNISTPLIFHLLNYTYAITDMHFMLQKELVDRLIAKPNSKEYGRLSVMVQYYCQVLPIMEVSPNAFIPSPKVYSAFVHLIPYVVLPNLVEDLRILRFITKKAFSQRRKMIHNSLGNLLSIDMLIEMDIDPKMRAENISVAQYCKIANYVSNLVFIKRN